MPSALFPSHTGRLQSSPQSLLEGNLDDPSLQIPGAGLRGLHVDVFDDSSATVQGKHDNQERADVHLAIVRASKRTAGIALNLSRSHRTEGLQLERLGYVPWWENVRDRGQVSPIIQLKTDLRYGDWRNRANYWLNQYDVREELLSYLSNVLENRSAPLQDFVAMIQRVHTLLIGGSIGNRWYQTGAFIYVRQHGRNQDSDEIVELVRLRDQPLDMDRLTSRIQLGHELLTSIILEANTMSQDIFIDRLSSLHWVLLFNDLDGAKPLPGSGKFPFRMGNNAFIMNLVNCCMRLYGLKGITHGKLDFNLKSSGQFKKGFRQHLATGMF